MPAFDVTHRFRRRESLWFVSPAFQVFSGHHDGFGVGLFVSKYIVETAFHSVLRVNSNPGRKGTTFSFSIGRRIPSVKKSDSNN